MMRPEHDVPLKSTSPTGSPAELRLVQPNSLEDLSLPERVMAIGGMRRPPEALSRFVEWAGGPDANIVVVGWATQDPQGAIERLEREFPPGITLTLAPSYTDMRYRRGGAAFLDQLNDATGLYMTGGDQLRLMDVFADPLLLGTVQERFHKGMPIGGTSAGAAVTPHRMYTGEDGEPNLDSYWVGTARGMGLIRDALVDQHFVQRPERFGRVIATLREGPEELAIGIPESTAVMVEDSHILEVIMDPQAMRDRSRVVIFVREHGERITMEFLNHGELYDLQAHQRIEPADELRSTGTG